MMSFAISHWRYKSWRRGGSAAVALALFAVGTFQSYTAAAVRLGGATSIETKDLADEYDVVVVGAGTGGVAAALQAARMGSSVLLLETTDWIGGQMAAAGVTSMDEGYPPRDHLRERGIYGEFWRRVSAFYLAIGKSNDTCAVSEDHFAVEPIVAQRTLCQMISDARLTPLSGRTAVLDVALRATVSEVHRDGTTVTGLEFIRSGAGAVERRSVRSQVVIDATEYGDLIPMTGARYRVGTLLTGRDDLHEHADYPVQPITWTAVIKRYSEGVPADLRVTTPPPGYNAELIRPFLAASGDGEWRQPWTWERMLKYRGMPDSTSPLSTRNGAGLVLTRTHVNFAPNDQPFDVDAIENLEQRDDAECLALASTLAVLYYARHEMGIVDWSVANDQGYDSPYNRDRVARLVARHPEMKPYQEVLSHFPVIPYVRESRRIVGVGALTATQLRRKPPYTPVQFPTAVAIGDYPVDVHGEHRDRERQVELDLDQPEDLPKKWIQWGYGPFQIPFEAFIPESVDGFLPAEKNLSQSRLASGATRLQPVTMLTGQAAGAIAAVAVRDGIAPREVRAAAVQSELLDAGSTLHPRRYSDVPHGTSLWKAVQLSNLYGILTVEGELFRENAAIKPTTAAKARKRLEELGCRINPNSESSAFAPATRGEVVRQASTLLRECDPPPFSTAANVERKAQANVPSGDGQ